jgi:biopolymer transport protein ExbD
MPLVDMLLGLVAFLLSTFSANAECAARQQVPSADNWIQNVEAPLVTVTPGLILVDGSVSGIPRDVLDRAQVVRIDALLQVLKNKRELWQALNPARAFPGVVILQVDRRVPALVVKSAVHTAAQAGYPNLSFEVEARGG